MRHPLTKRQLEVLALYASTDDLTTTEMGERLGIKAVTVRTHASTILLKLGYKRMRTAVVWYIREIEGRDDGGHRRDREGDGAPGTGGVSEEGAGEGAGTSRTGEGAGV